MALCPSLARGAGLCPGALPSAPARCRTTPDPAAEAGGGCPEPRPAVTVLHQRRLAGRPQPLQPARHRHGGRAVAAATRKLPPSCRKRFRPGRAERGLARPRPRPRSPLLSFGGPFRSPAAPPSAPACPRLPRAPPRGLGGRSCPRGCGCCQPRVGGLETLHGLRRLARQVWYPARGLYFRGVKIQPAETHFRALGRTWAPRTLAGFWFGFFLYLTERITVSRGLFLVKTA